MAAIYDENGTLDIDKLTIDIKEHLPAYARPQFVRILTKIDLTGMCKNNIILLHLKEIIHKNIKKC